MENKINIVLTGGHAATTALATVEEIRRRKLPWDLFWIGPKKAMEGKEISAAGARILPAHGVFHHAIVSGRLQAKWTRYSLPSLLKIPIGFLQSLCLLLRLRPQVLVSFGGYASFPVVVSAWILGIPVVVHTQTVAVGLANSLSVFFARKIAIARRESAAVLPRKKVVLIGNPILRSIRRLAKKDKIGNPPTIFITGGSTGSQHINEAVDKILKILLERFYVIHQTGELDFDYFMKRKKNLSAPLSYKYSVFDFIEPKNIWKVYKKADLLISRAGANTISEILVTRRPTILIPHPYVVMDEQRKNAALAEKSGIVTVLDEDDLTPEALYEKVTGVIGNWSRMISSYDAATSKLDILASKKLVELLEETLRRD